MCKKVSKLLFGIIIFLMSSFTLNFNVDASKSVSVTNKNYSDQKFYITISKINDSLSYSIQSADIACKHTSGKENYVGRKFFPQIKEEVSTSWSVSGWEVGTWNCWLYVDLTGDPFTDNRADFSIWKSTFPTCADVNNYNGNKQEECNSKKADNGDTCRWTNNKCVADSQPNPNPTPAGCTWCCGSNQKIVNGGCYEMNAENCEILNLCDTEPKCKGKCTKSDNNANGKYKVKFDSNPGYGIDCDSGFYVPSEGEGICQKDDAGSEVKFPSNSSDAYVYNVGYLIGWTKTKDGSNNYVCSSNSNTILNSDTIDKDTDYKACYKDEINGTRYALDGASADNNTVECGDALEISYCFINVEGKKFCNYTKNGSQSVTGIVYRDKLTQVRSSSCDEEEKEEVECTTKKQKNITGKHNFYMCVDKNDYKRLDDDEIEEELIEEANDLVSCKSGYKLKESYTSFHGNIEDGYVRVEVKCVKDGNEEETSSNISLSVSSANVESNGYGVIRVNASSKEGRIEKYYYSRTYQTPTSRSSWKKTNGNSFTISETPGIIYIWVMDSEGNISSGIGGAVFDTVNTDTTINKLELYDSNNKIQAPTGNTAYKVNGITSSNYVRLSNSLSNDSIIAEKGFNPFNMEYKLEVSSPTISVYATLTSTDASYVSGYEPRTVNLNYGINTILIKIKNKEGKERTYTILVTRTDDRKADNTLKELSVDVGRLDFNSNKAEYKVEIPASTKNVNVNATIGSSTASFVEGYKPGNVAITSDSTVKLIKVKSQTGTTRTYVITFVKKGTDIINDSSLQLYSLSIPGVRLAFESNISNYSFSVGYSQDVIDINSVLNNKDSKVIYKLKSQSDIDYKLVSNKGINLDVGENFVEIIVTKDDGSHAIYRLTIIRKEFGLEVSNDTTLGDLKVLGYDINFNPNKKEYTVKIKQERSLLITAIPNNDRSEVFIRGNDELTGFSTVRVKVVAENGEFDTYSIDIKKDAFNKTIEIAAIVAGVVIILGSSCIIVIKNKNKKKKEYYEE